MKPINNHKAYKPSRLLVLLLMAGAMFAFIPLIAIMAQTASITNVNGVISASYFFCPGSGEPLDGDLFSPGDEFSATVSITGNTGFAAMVIRIHVPEGLSLVGFELHNQSGIDYGFEGPESFPTTGNVFAGWTGRETDFTGNGNLFTYTFRVNDNARPISNEPISIAFANAIDGYDTPTNANKEELIVMLPEDIGEITVVSDAPWIRVDPNSVRIVNTTGSAGRATLRIYMGGMPESEHFDIITGALPDGVESGISITGLPDGIEASGYVQTDANGTGIIDDPAWPDSGILTLQITRVLVLDGTSHEEELLRVVEQLFGD